MNSDFIYWERASDKYPDYTLWGESGISPNDIAQGGIGNCWVLVGLSALAEYPERIYNIFHNTEKSEHGVYAINIYALGIPHTTYIDDYLPYKFDGSYMFA